MYGCSYQYQPITYSMLCYRTKRQVNTHTCHITAWTRDEPSAERPRTRAQRDRPSSILHIVCTTCTCCTCCTHVERHANDDLHTMADGSRRRTRAAATGVHAVPHGVYSRVASSVRQGGGSLEPMGRWLVTFRGPLAPTCWLELFPALVCTFMRKRSHTSLSSTAAGGTGRMSGSSSVHAIMSFSNWYAKSVMGSHTHLYMEFDTVSCDRPPESA